MPHDPELVAETRAWVTKATRDLAAAALETARAVYDAILLRLPEEARP